MTICTQDRQCILSNIRRGDPCGRPNVELTELGEIITETIAYIEEKTNAYFPQYVIMPDHIHAIIIIDNTAEGDRKGRPYKTLSQIVGALKSVSSNKWLRICKERNMIMGSLWQRSYYDHIVRNSQDMMAIRKYICDNPLEWLAENKEEYPWN